MENLRWISLKVAVSSVCFLLLVTHTIPIVYNGITIVGMVARSAQSQTWFHKYLKLMMSPYVFLILNWSPEVLFPRYSTESNQHGVPNDLLDV